VNKRARGNGLRGLLFDFDGLLLDTESAEFRSWYELYEQHGHVLEMPLWSLAIGTIGGFDPVEHLATLGSLPTTEDLQAQRRRVMELCESEDLRPGVNGLLDAARRHGVRTAVVSSSSRHWIESHLSHRDALDRFDILVCADHDASRAKPAPTLYLEALDRLEVHAHEAIAFEDSPNGIAAAKAAGIFCIAVPNPVTSSLDLSGADVIVNSLADFDLATVARYLRDRGRLFLD
jgi:HAD superfamily hydrolase (TIGR01509 family)